MDGAFDSYGALFRIEYIKTLTNGPGGTLTVRVTGLLSLIVGIANFGYDKSTSSAKAIARNWNRYVRLRNSRTSHFHGNHAASVWQFEITELDAELGAERQRV